MPHRVSYPGDFDDYEWADIELKGWLDGVRVVRDGDEFTLTIYDEDRLPQAIRIDVERLGYFAASRLLVVPRVTREDIELAIERIAEREFLDFQNDSRHG